MRGDAPAESAYPYTKENALSENAFGSAECLRGFSWPCFPFVAPVLCIARMFRRYLCMVKNWMAAALVSLLLGPAAASAAPDAVSAASQVYYQESSLTLEQLSDAMANGLGACTVATVNEDGSPLLVGGSPAMLNLTHVTFGWNNNMTMANSQRTGEAMLCYYVFDVDGVTKMDRHRGARLKLELETDEAVIEELRAAYPALPPYATIMKIAELLPLG